VIQERWEDWTRQELLAFWPHPLTLLAWEEGGVASTFIYRGRVIEDACECCEIVDFEVDLGENEASADNVPLRSVLLYFAFPLKGDALNAAKTMFSALEFPNERQALRATYWETGDGEWEWTWVGPSTTGRTELWWVQISLSQPGGNRSIGRFFFLRRQAQGLPK
jgi:hypothetical protein